MVLLQNYFNKRVPLFFYFFVTYVLLHNSANKYFDFLIIFFTMDIFQQLFHNKRNEILHEGGLP